MWRLSFHYTLITRGYKINVQIDTTLTFKKSSGSSNKQVNGLNYIRIIYW